MDAVDQAPPDNPDTDTPKPKLSAKETAAILEEAQKRFADVQERDQRNRDRQRRATEFVYVAGKQWDDRMRQTRGDDPTLEFPQLKQFVNQVVNDQRQNRPGIRVHPAGGPASEDVADILQGMVRGIEYASQAEAAYDSGFSNAVVGGRGYWRVCSEYESPQSFDQNLVIKRVADTMMVWSDIDYQEPDGSDKNFCFVGESMKRAEFEKRYPDAKAVSWQPTDLIQNWYPATDEIIVADYYRRVAVKRTLVMMSDGAKGWKDEMPTPPKGVTILKEREADDYRCEWYVLGGGEEILESHEWPGTMVPVIACVGEDVMVDGERMFDGLITQAIDAQRMYNYEKSAKAQWLMMQSLQPWTGPKAAFDGMEEIWKGANVRKYAYLPFNHRDADGEPIPAPQRVAPPPVPTGWVESAQSDKEDIKSSIGMYNNSLGLHGQETSGRAILAREKQGDNSTFHFVDNLSRAIALTGRIIVELIPHYYDTQRIVTTVGTDEIRSLVTINQPDPTQALGAIAHNDVRVGNYAVTVEAGPGYATKREEVRESLMALVQSFPQVMGVAGDIIAGTLDFDGASDLAERMKMMLPPPVQQMLAAKEQKQDPQVAGLAAQLKQTQEQAQQAVQQAQQGLQQAAQQVQSLEEQLKSKQGDLVLEAKKQDAEREYKDRELTLRERELALKEGIAEADVIMEAVKLQQTQAEPVGPEMEALAPVAEEIIGDQPSLAKTLSSMHDMLKQHLAAPRQLQVHMDTNGDVIGGTSSMMPQPEAVQ